MSLHGLRALVLFALVTALLPSTSHAQRPGRMGRPVVVLEQIETALADVNLTDEQKPKIDKILSAARSSARGLRGQLADADPATRRGMTRGFAVDIRDQVLAVLTAEQAQVFNQRLQGIAPAAAQAPTSQPAADSGQQQPRVGPLVERLYDFVIRLDLTDEQRPQVEALFAELRQQIVELRQNPPGDGTMPQRVEGLTQQLRQKLAGVLTPAQQARLRESIGREGPAPARGRGVAPPPPPMMTQPEMQMQQMQPGSPAPTANASGPIVDSPELDLPGVTIGAKAPEFTLTTTDNKPISLSNYKGKIVLLVFGSHTSPSFRQRAAAMEQLRRDYGTRINMLVIYTKENHPIGQWEVERNKDEGIAVEQATDLPTRLAQAKQSKTVLKFTALTLVDTMNDQTAKDYGGFTNAAVLIGRDGTVLARQKWFEPYALRRHIDEATKP